MRMRQNQEEPNKETDYEQSFQRLYQGFKNIHPEPILKRKQQKKDEEPLPPAKKVILENSREKGHLGKYKRLQYEHCLSWARKHNKNGDYFADQLGKNNKIIEN